MKFTLRKVLGGIIDILELLLGMLLTLLIIISITKIFKIIIDLWYQTSLSKDEILSVLDIILLLVLTIDILRTLFTAASKHALPLRIVIEAAILAVLREIIAVEVRHLSATMVIALSISFAVLVSAWIVVGILRKEGRMEEYET